LMVGGERPERAGPAGDTWRYFPCIHKQVDNRT
jgi:hypothetical protein